LIFSKNKPRDLLWFKLTIVAVDPFTAEENRAGIWENDEPDVAFKGVCSAQL